MMIRNTEKQPASPSVNWRRSKALRLTFAVIKAFHHFLPLGWGGIRAVSMDGSPVLEAKQKQSKLQRGNMAPGQVIISPNTITITATWPFWLLCGSIVQIVWGAGTKRDTSHSCSPTVWRSEWLIAGMKMRLPHKVKPCDLWRKHRSFQHALSLIIITSSGELVWLESFAQCSASIQTIVHGRDIFVAKKNGENFHGKHMHDRFAPVLLTPGIIQGASDG